MTEARPMFPPRAESVTLVRRSFLGRAAAALAGGAAVNITALATIRPAAAVVTEHPGLMDAGQRLDALQSEWRTADALRLEAKALAEKLCPPVPEELFADGVWFAGCTEYQQDAEGKVLYHEPRILDSARIELAIERGNLIASKRTQFGKKVHALIKTAKKYEADRDAAIDQSGLLDCKERALRAAVALDELAREVAAIEAMTMAGVSVQARALCAYAEAEAECGGRGWSAQIIGLQLAQSVARLQGDIGGALA